MKDIKVSIITVCYNSDRTIRKTIESVYNQTYKNIEYIIIDGLSRDGTIEIIDEYRDLFGDRLKVVSEPDDGIYYAMNKGIKMCTGDIVGIINSDDWYEYDAIEKIVKNYIEKHESEYEVYYGITGVIKNGELICMSKSSHNELEDEMISHPSCFVTRLTYERLGMFDTQYTSAADYDLMLRYKRSNKVRFVPIEDHIANFTLGGMCSTGNAYIDLLKLKMNYKKIPVIEGYIEIIKARIAIFLEDQGKKAISLRKK